MIKLTYEYFCDFCEQEFNEKETFELMPFVIRDNIVPHPKYNNALGNHHICPSCFQKALAPLVKERLEFNAKCRGN